MTDYAILLEPDKKLAGKITGIKDEVRAIAGEQLYLKDPPHISLMCVGLNEPFPEEGFVGVVADIKRIGKLSTGISGWKIFENDAITSNKTLVCSISHRYWHKLREVQDKVISFLNKHDIQAIARYIKVYENLPHKLRQNIDRNRFPFAGDIWEPHFGIASISPDAFKAVWERLRNKCPKGVYEINELSVYELNDDDLTPFKKYSLI